MLQTDVSLRSLDSDAHLGCAVGGVVEWVNALVVEADMVVRVVEDNLERIAGAIKAINVVCPERHIEIADDEEVCAAVVVVAKRARVWRAAGN